MPHRVRPARHLPVEHLPGAGAGEVDLERVLRDQLERLDGAAHPIPVGGPGRHRAANVHRPVRAAIAAAAPPFGAIGAGAVVLAIVPLGALPVAPEDWAVAAGAGVLGGVLCGIVLGLWIGTSPEHEPEVAS